MKNLFVLPTDIPSRLFFNKVNKKLLLENIANPSLKKVLRNGNYKNIYITNDEEIKEGDWYITILDNEIVKADSFTIRIMNDANKYSDTTYKNTHFKIILTTDQDLIKDGVQAIPDEFLEWFIKNPSCEEVDIMTDAFTVKEMSMLPIGTRNLKYKIIIPKEEPKQSAVEWLQEQLNKILIDNQIQQTLHLFEQAKQMEEEQRGYSEEHLIKVVDKFHSLQLNEFKSFLELLEFKKEEE